MPLLTSAFVFPSFHSADRFSYKRNLRFTVKKPSLPPNFKVLLRYEDIDQDPDGALKFVCSIRAAPPPAAAAVSTSA